MKHSVKDWILTTRPWSFPASAMPVLATLAYMTWVCSLYGMSIDWVSGVLAIVGIVFFHASGNMLSDVRDYKKGVDKLMKIGQFSDSNNDFYYNRTVTL